MATLTVALHSIRSRMVRPALLARAAAPSRGLPNSSVRRTLASRPRPPIRSEAASAVATAIAEAEANLTLRDHLIRIGLWSIISLNVGAYFGQGDEGAQVLLHLDEFAERILAADTKRSVLTEALERVSRGAASNDTLKLRLLAQPFLFDRLLALCTDARVGGPARNHAVKVLEAITGSPEAQREIVASGRHTSYLELMQHEGTSLYARKALAAAVCNLAELPDHAMTMGRVGTVSALMAEQEADARLRRKRVEVGAARLACALHALGADALAPLPSAERVLIERLAADEAAAAAGLGPLHSMRTTLLESGVLLYLHTAAGGAASDALPAARFGVGILHASCPRSERGRASARHCLKCTARMSAGDRSRTSGRGRHALESVLQLRFVVRRELRLVLAARYVVASGSQRHLRRRRRHFDAGDLDVAHVELLLHDLLQDRDRHRLRLQQRQILVELLLHSNGIPTAGRAARGQAQAAGVRRAHLRARGFWAAACLMREAISMQSGLPAAPSARPPSRRRWPWRRSA